MDKDEEDHSRNNNEESKLSRTLSNLFASGNDQKAATSSSMLNKSMVYNSAGGYGRERISSFQAPQKKHIIRPV